MLDSLDMVISPKNTDFKSVNEWINMFQTKRKDIMDKLKNIYGDDQAFLDERKDIFLRVLKSFGENYGFNHEVVITRSPCRINLRGMHSEMQHATPNYLTHGQEMIMVASKRDDDLVVLKNLDYDIFGNRQFRISEEKKLGKWGNWIEYIDSPGVRQNIQSARGDWENYIKAAILKLQDSFQERDLKGMNLTVFGDVPQGSGMSSSSTVVVASALAFLAVNDITIDRRELIVCLGRGEWYVGTRGGFGDHGAMLLGKRGHILHSIFLTVDEMKPEYIPLPEDFQVIIINSYKTSSKSAERLFAYNQTMFAYSMALSLIKSIMLDMGYDSRFLEQISYLGQITPEKFGLQRIYEILREMPERIDISELKKKYSDSEINSRLDRFFGQLKKFPDSVEVRGTALWGIAESERSRAFARLIKEGRIKEAGQLMYIGHDGDRLFSFESGKPIEFNMNKVTDDYLDKLISQLKSGDPDKQQEALLEKQPGDFDASSLELDTIVEILRNIPGVTGASLTGAGFGGNILAICEKNPELLDRIKMDLFKYYYEPQEQEELKWAIENLHDNQEFNQIKQRLGEIVKKKQKNKAHINKDDIKYAESIWILVNKLFQEGKVDRTLMFIPGNYYANGITVNRSVEKGGIL